MCLHMRNPRTPERKLVHVRDWIPHTAVTLPSSLPLAVFAIATRGKTFQNVPMLHRTQSVAVGTTFSRLCFPSWVPIHHLLTVLLFLQHGHQRLQASDLVSHVFVRLAHLLPSHEDLLQAMGVQLDPVNAARQAADGNRRNLHGMLQPPGVAPVGIPSSKVILARQTEVRVESGGK